MERIAQVHRRSRRRSLFGDVLESVREARPYRLWQNILAYLRRLRTISFILRLVGYLWAFLQTGTLVLLTTALFFIILPILAVITLGILLTAFLDMRKSRKKLEREIENKEVYVYFSLGDFGTATAKQMARDRPCVCLAVSPHWIASDGPCGSRFYLNLRREDENFFLIRRYFYFHIRKKLLNPDKTALIY